MIRRSEFERRVLLKTALRYYLKSEGIEDSKANVNELMSKTELIQGLYVTIDSAPNNSITSSMIINERCKKLIKYYLEDSSRVIEQTKPVMPKKAERKQIVVPKGTKKKDRGYDSNIDPLDITNKINGGA